MWCLRSSWAGAEPSGLGEAAPKVPTQRPGRDAAPWQPAPAPQFCRGNAFSCSKEAKIPAPAAGGLQHFPRLFPKSTLETQDWTPRGWSVPGAEAAAELAQPQFQQRLFPSGHRVRKRHSKERGGGAVWRHKSSSITQCWGLAENTTQQNTATATVSAKPTDSTLKELYFWKITLSWF